MSINLPHWLAEVVNILGFNWPEIDEDQLRDAAKGLRRYATSAQQSHDTTHGVVTGGLKEAYAAQSYTALAEVWGSQTQGHMKTLIEGCHVLADALDVAAVGVEGMKYECIAQLGIAAGELIADQVGAVFTLGLSEAAAAAEIELQNRLMDGIIQRFEQEVIGVLVDKTIGPLKAEIEHAVGQLLLEEVAHVTVGAPAPGLKLDTAMMRTHAGTIGQEADANIRHGQAFYSEVGHLTFKTG